MLFMCLVIKWMLLRLCLPKHSFVSFIETRFDAGINLRACKQRRFVEQAVIRIQIYYPSLVAHTQTHIVVSTLR